MPELLDEDDIETRMSRASGTRPPAPHYKYARPLDDAADQYVDWLTSNEERFCFGLRPVDAMIRGIGRGELCYVTGKAHSAKTQFVLAGLANNAGKPMIMFTPDEVDVLILCKLVGISRGVPVEDLENLVRKGDQEAIRLVHDVARNTFKDLIVIDETLDMNEMSVAMAEARLMWGNREPAVAVIDFLELLPGAGETAGVRQKSQDIKRWVKAEDVPGVCIHQAKRGDGQRGKAQGIEGMNYAGETEANYVIEVYRKRDGYSSTMAGQRADWNRQRDTVTVNVVKNKRPPCHKGEVDLWLEPTCGQIRQMSEAPPQTPFDQPDLIPTLNLEEPF